MIDRSIKENGVECDQFSSDDNYNYVVRIRGAPGEMRYLPTIPTHENIDGYSQIRQSILEKIGQQNRRRPYHNIVRNSVELKDSECGEGIWDTVPDAYITDHARDYDDLDLIF